MLFALLFTYKSSSLVFWMYFIILILEAYVFLLWIRINALNKSEGFLFQLCLQLGMRDWNREIQRMLNGCKITLKEKLQKLCRTVTTKALFVHIFLYLYAGILLIHHTLFNPAGSPQGFTGLFCSLICSVKFKSPHFLSIVAPFPLSSPVCPKSIHHGGSQKC